MSKVRILVGDCRTRLRELPEQSVQTCVTSPPYFGLRDYGHAEQIGLEKTPDAFVTELVSVFREVKRVLRDDGTLWLNLGDSYAGYWGDKKAREENRPSSADNNGWTNGFSMNSRPSFEHLRASGIKPKDLIGIPWRVAFALQQPYYAGDIKRLEDRVWLAAMLDAEGCLFIHKRKAGQNAGDGYQRQSDTYSPGLEISNTHETIVARCAQIAGVGSVAVQDSGRRQRLYRWTVRAEECRRIVRELYPHLVGKQHQARVAFGCPTNGERAEAAHEALKVLHSGGDTSVDFAAPSSLFESGFYLRSDVIWAKPNPMPESVTDRPTKSHEYLFLLTKSERYYYDSEAIQEDSTGGIKGAAASFKREDSKRGQHGISPNSPMATHRPDREDVRYDGPKRNKRSVWTVATLPYSGAHFATFPPALIEPCIKAGTSQHGACSACGAPWVRVVERERSYDHTTTAAGKSKEGPYAAQTGQGAGTHDIRHGAYSSAKTIGWNPGCRCDAHVASCVVLDPFGGAGTTGLVADRLGRNAILCELNPEYATMAAARIRDENPMFAEVSCE